MGSMAKPTINYREPQKTAYNILSTYKFNKVSYIFIFLKVRDMEYQLMLILRGERRTTAKCERKGGTCG